MEAINTPVFQSDSEIVNKVYSINPNYKIIYDNKQVKKYCAVYFSSNDIYFPNNEISFRKAIIDNDKFEWFNTRISYANKHIFLRDIQKQWYITGINKSIDSPKELIKFLISETEGYSVIMVGSSAGGFAASLYGSILNAKQIFTFNGQFEVKSQLKKSTPLIDPVLFRNQSNEELFEFYDAKKYIEKTTSDIFYFYSSESDWDCEQFDHVKETNIYKIGFKTNHHGIPFPKSALPKILTLQKESLTKFNNKKFNPITFSIKQIGIIGTMLGIVKQVYSNLNKRIFQTVNSK